MKKAFLKLWREYFNFTKGERNAFFVLIAIILIVSVYPFLSIEVFKNHHTDFSELIALAEKNSTDTQSSDQGESFQEYPEKHTSFTPDKFRFNPNTVSVKELEQLGFKNYIARRIEKYRLAGGKFKIKSDLKKVYGIDPLLVDRLWHEIQLPETLENNTFETKTTPVKETNNKKLLVDLNAADTSELIRLPGIGSKLAKRIVDFRTKLGGFYSVEQLHEVYGLKPETIAIILPQMTLTSSGIRTIDINTLDYKALESHPYIDRNQANAIIEYRKQHGDYHSVQDLLKVQILNETFVDKIKYYIKF